jgi:hypothetical protein
LKTRLILHLGLWKTGTTTLQYFLRENPDVLAGMGILYPKVGSENADHPFFRAKPATAFLADEVSHQFLARELAGWRRLGPIETPLWSTVFRLIEDSGAHTAIISYEDFSARISRYQFQAIADRLKTFDVTGIIYVRPQEDWAVSLYSHLVRELQTTMSFSEFLDDIRPRLVYSVLLDRLRGHVPLDSLTVRNFDEATKGGLIQDFFARLDLPDALSASDHPPEVRNRSLPHWAVLFLRNCIQASLSNERLLDIRFALIRSAVGRPSLPLRPGLDVASPAERARLRAIMSADAERLKEHYGTAFAKTDARPTLYRPFDQTDFNEIKDLITPRLSLDTRAALDRL